MKSLEERKALANAEMLETVRWFNNEIKQIYIELNEKQGLERKFDGGNEPYVGTHKEFARRMKEIGEKYNLPRVQKNRPTNSSG